MLPLDKYFYESQRDRINDDSHLKIAVKSRQTGFSFCNAFRLALLVSGKDARLDAYISSRDQFQAKLQLEDCLHWPSCSTWAPASSFHGETSRFVNSHNRPGEHTNPFLLERHVLRARRIGWHAR